jgi:fatty-acyl-CoA synthase
MSSARSYAQGLGETPLLGRTIGEDLERTVARFPAREALVSVHQDLRYTYAELNDAVDRLACGLLAAGIAHGDRVGIWSPNCAEWVLVQYATAKVGAVLVNVNPAYRAHELGYALRQSGMKLLISASAFKTSDYVAMVEQVRGELPDLERAIFLGGDEWAALAGTPVERDALETRRSPSTSRSTSSTRAGRRASRRVRRSPTTTSSTTASSSASCSATASSTASASPSPSTTASAW